MRLCVVKHKWSVALWIRTRFKLRKENLTEDGSLDELVQLRMWLLPLVRPWGTHPGPTWGFHWGSTGALVDPLVKTLRPIMEGWKPGWRRACLLRWSLRMKRLSQSGQRKRFSPVCVRVCRASSSERANFFSQSGQVQGNGLSPGIQQERAVREIFIGRLTTSILSICYTKDVIQHSFVRICFSLCDLNCNSDPLWIQAVIIILWVGHEPQIQAMLKMFPPI